MTSEIPFIDLATQRERIGDALRGAMEGVLEHGRFIQGPEVGRLEAELSARCGGTGVVACGSGTDALLLPLLAAGIGPGDAVLVPAFTFPATPEVVVRAGATPVFVDIDTDSFTIHTSSVEAGISVARREGLRPAAVIAVDLFGQPADYDEIDALAGREGLRVICDAAQSFGASYRDQSVGTLGWVTATSFFPAKPLGCFGDGGAIFVADEETEVVLRSLREHGKGRTKYETARVGTNSRLDTLQAAVLLEKLRIFDDELGRRQAVADRYGELLPAGVRKPSLAEGRTSTWAQYTVRLPDREAMGARLREEGIPTAIYYPEPLHRQPAFADAPRVSDLTNSETVAAEVLSLPMHPYVTADVQARVAGAVERALA